MIQRRAFLVGSAASAASLVAGERASAEIFGKAIEWFIEAVKLLPRSLDGIYRGLLYLKGHYRLLVDDRERLRNVRRELTDATEEKSLQTKLGTWLMHYDAWVAEKPRPGESDADFAARKERERTALQREWKTVRDDAASALKTIKTIGAELDNIDPNLIPAPEWRQYRELLKDEKDLAEFLDTDMPTDPSVLDRMRETAEQLKLVVQTIDRYAGQLDEAIKKAG